MVAVWIMLPEILEWGEFLQLFLNGVVKTEVGVLIVQKECDEEKIEHFNFYTWDSVSSIRK